MKIAFLSSYNPKNISSWSGTLFHMFTSLKKLYTIEWVGNKTLEKVYEIHKLSYEGLPFVPERYAQLFGKLLSDYFKYEYYDIIICKDYFFGAYLLTDIPVIYIGDTTFKLFNQHMKIMDRDFIELANNLEYLSIKNATEVIYCSEWAKSSAISDYQGNPNKIKIIEFGANLNQNTELIKRNNPDSLNCNLLFVGLDWERKGGEKVLMLCNTLTNMGIHCTLTIVGHKIKENTFSFPVYNYPFLDKNTSEGYELLQQLYSKSHFLIHPASFECYGIVLCEAMAYGCIPLASNVGGIPQIVSNGENGFLLPPQNFVESAIEIIKQLISDRNLYLTITKKTIASYHNCFNWEIWLNKINIEIKSIIQDSITTYIPVYIINLNERKERKKHILNEFRDKKEFLYQVISTEKDKNPRMGLWNNIVHAVNLAKRNNDDIIIICEDDHYFTENYSSGLLIKEIYEAYEQGADILLGGIGGFGQAIPVGYRRYWIDSFWCTQFLIIYKQFYNEILSYKFKETDTADGVLSQLTMNKMVIYPFISEQKDFGYSDVTLSNMENAGRIREHFEYTKQRLKSIEYISRMYNKPI